MEAKVNISMKVVDDLKIRSRRDGEILGICPVCGCRDANFNTSKLIWRCWHCPSSGKITAESNYEIKEVDEPKFDVPEIRKLYASLTDKYHDSLFPNAVDYLKARGLTNETIERFKLGFCSTDYYDEYSNKVAEDSGIIYQNFPILSNRIVIPYVYHDEVVDLRGRILDSIFTYKKNTPTYVSLSGSHESRGAGFLFNHDIIDKENLIVITEGEFKAIIAIQYGFPVVATPGIFGWNTKWSIKFKDKETILVADNERISGLRSPAYLMAKLLLKEIPHLKIGILFRNAKQSKVDIDSYILQNNKFENCIRGAMNAMEWLKQEERKGYGRR
jgi:hypothetical protein